MCSCVVLSGVRICIYVYVYMHMCICTCICMYMWVCVYICLYVYVSELSGHVDIISSIIIWTSQCVLNIIIFSAGVRHPSINTYYFGAVGCHTSITSSEARWWNPECINTYKVSTIVITDYILNYIKEICMGTIYIKSRLGIIHFAHNYMETAHVASKPKLLKTLARSGIWTHDLQITCLTLSHIKGIGIIIDAGMASTRGKNNDVKHTPGSSYNNWTYDINMPG